MIKKMEAENKGETRLRAQSGRMSRSAKAVVMICALLGALILWIYAIGYDSTIFESTFNGIEVTVTGEDMLASEQGFTLAGGQNFSSVTVVASGKRSELNELDSTDFRAVVDVSSVTKAGDSTLPIVIYSPNGIGIESQSSSTVTVFIDEFTQKDQLLSVSVDTGNGYVMSEGIVSVEAVANPLSVSVSGPKSVLDTVAGAFVRFDLDGVVISKPIYGYGTIELRDSDGNVINNPYITVSDTTAYVAITVRKTKSIPVTVQFVGGVFDIDSASVTVSTSGITVTGTPDALDSFDSIVLNIDESTISRSGKFDFQVSSLLPQGIDNASGISKITVDVVMPEMSVRTYEIPSGRISFVNLPDGSSAEVKSKLSITVIGARDAIAQIDRKAITAIINFDNVTENDDGSFSAVPELLLGADIPGAYILNSGYTVSFVISQQ